MHSWEEAEMMGMASLLVSFLGFFLENPNSAPASSSLPND